MWHWEEIYFNDFLISNKYFAKLNALLNPHGKLNQISVFSTKFSEGKSARQMTVHFVNVTLLSTFGQFLSGRQSHHSVAHCPSWLRGKFCTLAVKDNCFCIDPKFFTFDAV